MTVQTIFINRSDQPLTLEMLASFSLSGITPFAVDDAPGRLYLHRFRSYWSAEGRHECRLAEDLGLEPSWAHHGVRVERFGQVGSMPVRGFFPWAGVEDRAAGVMWGAQLAIPGSWQMEFYRRDDFLCLSGGLADREFGHWMKTIAPGRAVRLAGGLSQHRAGRPGRPVRAAGADAAARRGSRAGQRTATCR